MDKPFYVNLNKLLFEFLQDSINELYLNDRYIVDLKMELACSAKVLHYMMNNVVSNQKFSSLKSYDIDIEYGKDLKSKKTTVDHPNGIRPDLIIHRRGKSDNLLAVEFKMEHRDLSKDVSKLKELTSREQQYSYDLGILCVIESQSPAYLLFYGGEKYE
jgi:hypothetical protein